MIIQYKELNQGATLLARSYMVPCTFAWANIPKIGIKTAVIVNPKKTNPHFSPELAPKKGGRIRFPAPKKRAKRAKPVIQTSLFFVIIVVFCQKRVKIIKKR